VRSRLEDQNRTNANADYAQRRFEHEKNRQ
jgi:hypothetical protein